VVILFLIFISMEASAFVEYWEQKLLNKYVFSIVLMR